MYIAQQLEKLSMNFEILRYLYYPELNFLRFRRKFSTTFPQNVNRVSHKMAGYTAQQNVTKMLWFNVITIFHEFIKHIPWTRQSQEIRWSM